MTEHEYQRNKEYPLRETWGTFTVTPTSGRHIYVDANHNSGSDLDREDGKRITVRGIPYGVSVHLYLADDGTWGEGDAPDRLGLYMSRLDRYTGPRDLYPSEPAQRWVREHLYPVVAAWAAANPEALREAAAVDRNNTLWRLEEKRDKARAELDAIESEMAQVTAEDI
jgi:hypothetical protein